MQLGWEGSVLDAAQGVVFCMLLSLTGWMLLVHKSHRVAMFNTLARDPARALLTPSTALFLLYTGTAVALAFSRCACCRRLLPPPTHFTAFWLLFPCL